MIGYTIFSSILTVASVAAASPAVRPRTPYHVKEKHFVPRGWRQVERAPKHHMVQLEIGVRQNNFAELERHLYEVSDPDHHRYGDHLSAGEVNELVKPTNESLDLVHEWLADHDISPSGYSAVKDWISVKLPISTIEHLLGTEYHTYEHEEGSRVHRTSEWSLPKHLHSHIDTIQPTTSFFRARADAFDHVDVASWIPEDYKPPVEQGLGGVCKFGFVTPHCFHKLYSIEGYTTRAADRNAIGFTNYLLEHPIRRDSDTFLARYLPRAGSLAKRLTEITIADGPVDSPLTRHEALVHRCREANLDLQTIAGIVSGTPITSYSTGGAPPFIPDASLASNNTNEPFLVWINWLLAQSTFPQVITTSYSDDERTVPRAYAKRVCQQFAQAGARGTTLLFSSGDSGVGGDPKECGPNNSTSKMRFLPSFPSTCPYITSVGATMEFQPEKAAFRPAYMAQDGKYHFAYASGGGFSDYFPMPAYQANVAIHYIDRIRGLHNGKYNKRGRGYPDLAAQGSFVAYVWNDTWHMTSGTSASAPIVGAIFSLVNDALLADGKKPLGFLNPWLYKRGVKGLTDIKKGSSVGCGTEGFPAKRGWDAVTGLGTPIFPFLVELAGGRVP